MWFRKEKPTPRHALSPLFHAGHAVITALRESGAM